jgi:hypothetical protein
MSFWGALPENEEMSTETTVLRVIESKKTGARSAGSQKTTSFQ